MRNFFYDLKYQILVPVVLGILSFLLIIGASVLDPTHIGWLTEGDLATHYLGWVFFLQSPWSFPLGLNPQYGLEISNSILFSDSIPLFAFFFKVFKPFLSDPFQYFGFWLLICFIFQAIFSWKLIELFSENFWIRLWGCVFFVFSQPMLNRMLNDHLALSGHFLILAAFYFALNKSLVHRKKVWCTLIALTAMIHVYLLLMVFLIWLTHAIGRKQIRSELFVVMATLLITCWQTGYFTIIQGAFIGGYGGYAMNLLSLVVSPSWSHVFSFFLDETISFEGNNFLGLGAVFLLVFYFLFNLKNIQKWPYWINLKIKEYRWLVFLLLGLSIFSISHHIQLGSFHFSYRLPSFVIHIANIFRASGRMFWPSFYIILLTILVLVMRSYEKKIAISLFFLGAILQAIDSHAGWGRFEKKFKINKTSTWITALKDPLWEDLALKYKKIRRVQAGNYHSDWWQIAYYAAKNHLATDIVYLARLDRYQLEKLKSKTLYSLLTNQYETDTIYIIDSQLVIYLNRIINLTDYQLLKIDGLDVVIKR